MPDACYSSAAVGTAVDLANTLRPVKGEDALETVEQLRRFLDEHPPAAPPHPAGAAAAPWPAAERRLTPADLVEVRALRETVRSVLERAGTDPAGAATLINDGLRHGRAVPALRHDDGRWRIDAVSETDTCSARLAVAVLGALAAAIATLGPDRLGVCAGPNCRSTYVDLSRNGSKQYCTRTCAHRASVTAYRARLSPS